MPTRTIRLLHRVAEDWTADTFRLCGRSARSRHDDARDRAHALARRLPDAWHRPREPRVLRSWQERIGRVAAKPGGRS
jgi:hypothetical protein